MPSILALFGALPSNAKLKEHGMKPIVVTGGAGFIGSHLVDALVAKGKTVVVIDDFSTGSADNLDKAKRDYPSRLVVHSIDICSPEANKIVKKCAPEIVYHLAAQSSVKVSMRDPLLDATANIVGIVNMLQAAKEAGARKVVFSSSGGTIYGDHPELELPLTEEAVRKPESFYGLTKSAAVDYLRIYSHAFSLQTVALAFGNVYGPRQSPYGESGVIGIFAQKLLSGEPCVINGDGLMIRDYIHINDAVTALLAAGGRGEGLYNIGTGIETNVLDIFNGLTAILGVNKAPVHGKPLPGDIRRVQLDNSKAERELRWKAKVGLTEGMKTVVDWLVRAKSDCAN